MRLDPHQQGLARWARERMEAWDVVWHVWGLILPALGVGALSAAGAKLLWRQALRAVPWWRLAAAASAAGVVCLMGGLMILGRDGRMASYVAVVMSSAAALWWVGFRPRRG